jgi:diguanylate cyclase (GGDEF)-like protein/putative nucleotidyltransferase with HDIG domain/PAS domain S-box-containing protein
MPAGGGEPSAGQAFQAVLRNVVNVYVAVVFLAGVGVTVIGMLNPGHLDLVALGVFCLAAGFAEMLGVAVSEDTKVSVSLSLALVLAAVVALGPGPATVTAIAAAAARIFRHPRPSTQKMVFNVGLFAVEAGAAGFAYQAVGGALGHHSPTLRDAAAAAAAMVAYFLVTWPLLMGIVHLTTGRSLSSLWVDFRWMPAQIVVSAAVGFTLGTAFLLFGWAGAAIYVAPLIAVREAMRQYTKQVGAQIVELRAAHSEADAANQQLRSVNEALDVTNEGLLKTLASVIDARDVYLYGHSVQASKYAGEVARIMKLPPEQVRITELGALLHDLGKIGISEAILNKPARLTDEEYEEIKSHCEIGYHLLSNLPQFEEVAEIVYSHHEEYDGTGYPRKLKGEEIPIGARIVSVVEATEAMISDRPYRRGMTPDEVLQELANGAGTQWDAEVVRIFSALLSSDRKHLSMRNSALEIALSRTPIAELAEATDAPSLEGVTATFHGATQPIFILDQDYRVVAANPAAQHVSGYTEEQLQEQGWADLTGATDPGIDSAHNLFSGSRTVRLRRVGGDMVTLEVTGTPLRTNSASYWMVLAHEMSARRADAKPSNNLDLLTGLGSAESFDRELAAALTDRVEPLTVALLDVDAITAINETFGRQAGDAALRLLAQVLQGQLRHGDVAARLDGATFAMVMRRASLQDAGRVLQRVEDALPDARNAAEIDAVVEFCSGAAQWNGQESGEELLARARLWLEAEKRSRRPGPVVTLPITRDRRKADARAEETRLG